MKKMFLILLLSFQLCSFAQEVQQDWSDFSSIEKQYSSVEEMYGELNLSENPLFTGKFINFGYWRNIHYKDIISLEQRLESEKNLYRYVSKNLDILPTDNVIEIGIGLGCGSALLLEEFNPSSICGIDRCKKQIDRALEANQEIIQKFPNRLIFNQGVAEYIPYPNNYFDKLFSVEALQHFDNIDAFTKEAYRVLNPSGCLVVTTYFSKIEHASEKLKNMIPIIEGGSDHAYFILDLKSYLEKNGFKEISIESIGEHVWPAFNQWITQVGYGDTWNKNWYEAYKEGLVDYYIIKARK